MSRFDGIGSVSGREQINPLGGVIGRGVQSLRREYGKVVDGFDNDAYFNPRYPDQVDEVRKMLSDATLKRLQRRPDSVKLPKGVVLPEDGVAFASDAVERWGVEGPIKKPESKSGLTDWQDRRIDWALELTLQRDQMSLRGGDHEVVADYGHAALGDVLRESTQIQQKFGDRVRLSDLDSTTDLWVPFQTGPEIRKGPGLVTIDAFMTGVMGALGEIAPSSLTFTERKRLDQVGNRTAQLWTSPDAGRRAEEFRLEAPKTDPARGITQVDALSVLHQTRKTGPVPDGTMDYVQEAVVSACDVSGIDYAHHNSLLVRQQRGYVPPVR